MKGQKEPFLLQPERIGATPNALSSASVFLTPEQAPNPRDGTVPAIKRILNGDSAEFIMMTYRPGQVLADHHAAHPITIQCLEGRLRLVVGDDTYALEPGRVAHLAAQVVHRVECEADAPERNVLLLTMLTAAGLPPQATSSRRDGPDELP